MFTSDDPDREIYELFSNNVVAAIDLFIVDWFYKTHQDFSPICTCLKNLHTNLWGFVVDDKVTRLQKNLAQELNLRNALNRGLHRALGSLPRIPNNLPVEVMNRLSSMILESQLSKKKIMGRQRR
jgi:hypothetical protein